MYYIKRNSAICLKTFHAYFIFYQFISPNEQSGACLSIIHQNIRSIRNKFDYIQDHFLDFEIICFTETDLDNVIKDDKLF